MHSAQKIYFLKSFTVQPGLGYSDLMIAKETLRLLNRFFLIRYFFTLDLAGTIVVLGLLMYCL